MPSSYELEREGASDSVLESGQSRTHVHIIPTLSISDRFNGIFESYLTYGVIPLSCFFTATYNTLLKSLNQG